MLEKNPKILQFLSARICQAAYREKLDFSEKESQRHLLPPATKLGQGYVFTGVCHSVNRGGST